MQMLKLLPHVTLAFGLAMNALCQAQTKKATNVGISVQDLGNPFFAQNETRLSIGAGRQTKYDRIC